MVQGLNSSTSENRLSLNLSGPGEFLPRIAEEKDSPTNGQEGKEKCDKSLESSKTKTVQENVKHEVKVESEEPSTRGVDSQKIKICDKNQSELEKDKKECLSKMPQKDSKPPSGEIAANTNKTKSETKSKESRKEDKVSGKPPPK